MYIYIYTFLFIYLYVYIYIAASYVTYSTVNLLAYDTRLSSRATRTLGCASAWNKTIERRSMDLNESLPFPEP